MTFKVGDRVRISDTAQKEFIAQAKGNVGTILKIISIGGWSMVRFDHGYQNNYPIKDLISAAEHQPMEAPEISLDEIEDYQEIYRKLEEEKEKVHD